MDYELYLLHQNKKGEWGMWREYYKGGTAIYWEPANELQLYDLNKFTTEKRKRKYIIEQKKMYELIAPEPIHFNIF